MAVFLCVTACVALLTGRTVFKAGEFAFDAFDIEENTVHM
jgi:hypothetical protein